MLFDGVPIKGLSLESDLQEISKRDRGHWKRPTGSFTHIHSDWNDLIQLADCSTYRYNQDLFLQLKLVWAVCKQTCDEIVLCLERPYSECTTLTYINLYWS